MTAPESRNGLRALLLLGSFLVSIPSFAIQADVDGDGQVAPLTDGLIIIRHLFGLSGPSLVNGALGQDATRSSAQITAYLQLIAPLLDVDDDGQTAALTDGLLVLRHLFGLSGIALIGGAVGGGADRDTAPEVQAYVSFLLTPGIQVVPDPENFLVGDATNVRIQAQVFPHVDLDPASVAVFEVDENLDPVAGSLCSLLDNGSLGNGDDIAADGVFSCITPFFEDAPRTIRLLVVADLGPTTVSSLSFLLNAVEPLTMEQAQTIVEVQDAAFAIWLDKLAESGDTLQARLDAVAEILLLAGVADAGVSEDDVTIWILYDSGVLGGLMLNPDGTRGNAPGAPSGRVSNAPQVDAAEARDPARFTRPLGATLVDTPPGARGVVSADEPIGNTNVLIWDAYNSQFAPFDEGPALQTLYQSAACPDFDVTYLIDGQATVDSVRTFPGYGTIILVTHGAVDGEGQVVFLTRETADLASILAHAIDLVLQHVSVMGDVFAIRPSFIADLDADFQSAVVYNGSCQSSANGTMANAFFARGAETYYGYTRVVNSDFAQSSAVQLFTDMVMDLANTNEAFTPVTPKVDPTDPNATFTQSGNLMLAYTGELLNGDFETGDLFAWDPAGDARVLTALGAIPPAQGSYTGIISTGLGFTTSSGSIEQSFCLPAAATSLEFQWNFNSEEFVEWCGTEFDDTFQVLMQTDGGTFTLFDETISSLCASVFPTGLFFDQSGPGCVPDDFNDCMVHGTGWVPESLDIEGIAGANQGKGVNLVFTIFDTGDSIFDSAVLVDDIQVVVP